MYLAHSLDGRPEEEWHSLAGHLEATAAIAELNAAGVWGRAAGPLHDVGKYSAEFQARVRGAPERVDHSTAGAQIAVVAAELTPPYTQILHAPNLKLISKPDRTATPELLEFGSRTGKAPISSPQPGSVRF